MTFAKFLDPKNDYAFKRIFGTERNKDILIHFLNDMLELNPENQIEDLSFLQTNQSPEIAIKKESIVDVLCRDKKGVRYIVEMQVAKTDGFERRAQYYAAKTYVSQMNSGEKYADLKEVIFLAITNYTMFPNKPGYKSDHVILDRDSQERDLKDFSFTFVELSKFNKKLEDLKTTLDRWIYFFKHAQETTEKELPKITQKDQIIARAFEELNQFSWSEAELITYEAEKKRQLDYQATLDAARNEGLAEGRAEGRAKGLAEGRTEERLEIAKAMLNQGMKPDLVSKITQLPIDKINKLTG